MIFVSNAPDSAHLYVLVYTRKSCEFPVSLIVPWSILNDSPVHIRDIKTSIRSNGSVNKAGVEIGGPKEFQTFGLGFTKHEFTIRVLHISPANHMNGGITEKIGSPGIVRKFISPVNRLTAGGGKPADCIDLTAPVSC